MAANPEALQERELISFKLNGRKMSVQPGETILQVAKCNGVEIPHLCYWLRYQDSSIVPLRYRQGENSPSFPAIMVGNPSNV